MSKFSDLLGKPLPSKANDIFESFLNENDDEEMEDSDVDAQDTPEETEGTDCGYCQDEDCDDEPESLDGINSIVSNTDDDEDIDDMSDDELSALDAELSGNILNNIALDDEDSEVTLTPDEEQEADDMMGVAATTVLINSEMNKDEKEKFIESAPDVQAAINEGLLLESDVDDIAVGIGLVNEAGNNYNKKMIIRLDKEAKQKQLYAIAVNVSAAAHHDPDYAKLKKLNAMRKIIRQKLNTKYHSEATKRMKVYYKRLVSSNSAPLKQIGKDLEKDNK